ncbi:MAG: ferrochelatase [Sulfuricellaceae bacterium]|jgi:ferrochelatase
MRYLPEPPASSPARVGVLLLNLGTPDAPTKAALRRYLREFLSDPRVVELPRLLWRPILHGIILNTRPTKSAAKYAAVWTPGGSPLLAYTAKQAKLLRGHLGEKGVQAEVDFAMRYGSPSIADALARLKTRGCDRILALPLYPQYSGATTGSAFDGLFQALTRLRNVPEIRTLRHYPDHAGYIGALAAGIKQHWARHGRPDVLLMSFHGMPQAAIDQGDPYRDDCLLTGRALAQALNLAEKEFRITFQSRFGKAQWLQPYTDRTLAVLPSEGAKRVDVVCPGFAADCLETLEEIALEGKATFLGAGGREFHYIPALNDRPEWIAALAEIVRTHLSGWAG